VLPRCPAGNVEGTTDVHRLFFAARLLSIVV